MVRSHCAVGHLINLLVAGIQPLLRPSFFSIEDSTSRGTLHIRIRIVKDLERSPRICRPLSVADKRINQRMSDAGLTRCPSFRITHGAPGRTQPFQASRREVACWFARNCGKKCLATRRVGTARGEKGSDRRFPRSASSRSRMPLCSTLNRFTRFSLSSFKATRVVERNHRRSVAVWRSRQPFSRYRLAACWLSSSGLAYRS
jgi:hypothetical protein